MDSCDSTGRSTNCGDHKKDYMARLSVDFYRT